MGSLNPSPAHCTIVPILTFNRLAAVMASSKGGWASGEQLPVEIELGREYTFHSIFACPVSREQSSAENPPMLLPCSHVLAKQVRSAFVFLTLSLAFCFGGRPLRTPLA